MGNKSYSINTESTYDLSKNKSCKVHVHSTGTTKKSSLGAIFDEADTNNNGKISVRELKAFLTKKGVNCWSEKQFKDMFRDGDTSRDGNIDFLEFKTVMNAAKSSWNSNSKWKELLDKANAQAGTAVEIKLFRLNGSGQGVTTYGKTCVAASTTRIGQSANGNDFVLFGKSCFRQGTSYYFSLHEVKDHLLLEGMELARSQTFQCIDSLALIRAQVAAQVARDRAAAKAALRSAQVLAKRRRQIEKDAHDLFTIQRQESEQDLLDRIRARENRSNKRSVPTRQAAVVIDEVFDMIDANGNGKISMSEMKAHIKISVPEISTSDVGKMFREADKDKNAQLSKREFREVMVSAKRCCSIPAWNALYASYENRIAPSRSVNKRRRR